MIRDAARSIFGDDVRIIPFGSRIDDTAGGGDVDLMLLIGKADTRNPSLSGGRGEGSPIGTRSRCALSRPRHPSPRERVK